MPLKFRNKDERDLMIVSLYEELNSMQKVADKIGVSKTAIYKVLKKMGEDKEKKQAVTAIKKAHSQRKEAEIEELLDIIKSVRVSNIVDDALGLLNKQTLKEQIDTKGIQAITSLVGMFMDKALKLKSMEIERMALEVKSKEASNTRTIIIEGEHEDNSIELQTPHS
jgi:transposase